MGLLLTACAQKVLGLHIDQFQRHFPAQHIFNPGSLAKLLLIGGGEVRLANWAVDVFFDLVRDPQSTGATHQGLPEPRPEHFGHQLLQRGRRTAAIISGESQFFEQLDPPTSIELAHTGETLGRAINWHDFDRSGGFFFNFRSNSNCSKHTARFMRQAQMASSSATSSLIAVLGASWPRKRFHNLRNSASSFPVKVSSGENRP